MEQELKNKYQEKRFIKKSVSKKRRKNKISSLFLVTCFVFGVLIGVLGSVMYFKTNEKSISHNNGDIITSEENISTTNSMEEMLEEKYFTIETPIIDLYYPAKWEKQIRVEQVQDEVYVVQFYALLGEKEEVHIFDIVFGEIAEPAIGTIKDKDGNPVEVHVVSYKFEEESAWSDKDADDIYMMLEDSNYVIGMLKKKSGLSIT